MSVVNQIAGVFGPDCKITPMRKEGYTLEQHIAKLQQQEQADIQQTIARRRNKGVCGVADTVGEIEHPVP